MERDEGSFWGFSNGIDFFHWGWGVAVMGLNRVGQDGL